MTTASLNISGTPLTTPLMQIMMCQNIEPGSDPSYEMCKIIYEYHPLGAKMAEAPISIAQSQARKIALAAGPEEELKKAFEEEWNSLGIDAHIFNHVSLSRVYGVASVGILTKNSESWESVNSPLDYAKLYKQEIAINVWDPLNTSGSLVLNQMPNAPDFLKQSGISVAGVSYHRSRTCVKMNEKPIYLGYTTSSFGYVGRSVYQRALYPLKSFLQTMITDDMVSRKAGVLIAKIKQAGSIVDNIMATMAGLKRDVLKESQTNNVISIHPDEDIETLNLQNVNNAMEMSRSNILKNIATSADMPALLLENETLTEGFGEGSEDAKLIAQYVERFRIELQPVYDFFTKIVQFRAWNPEFYKTLQSKYPQVYSTALPWESAFFGWVNNFTAKWPSLIREPESEAIKVEDIRLKAIVSLLQVLLQTMDGPNRAKLIQWAAENFNDMKMMFQTPLILDYEALAEFEPVQGTEGENAGPGKPSEQLSRGDTARTENIVSLLKRHGYHADLPA